MNQEEMKEGGERVWTILKMLNVREGFSRKDDRFPDRWLEPLVDGEDRYFLTDSRGVRLRTEDLQALLDGYYEEHGWDVLQGIPTPERLAALELDFIGFVGLRSYNPKSKIISLLGEG